MIENRFRVQTFRNDGVGASLQNTGYDPGGIVVGINQFDDLTYSKAMAQAIKQNRFYESAGIDCRTEVFGKPIETFGAPYNHPGSAAPLEQDSLRPFSNAEAAEQSYARIDSEPPSLRRAISYRNRSNNVGLVGVVDEPVNEEPVVAG